jgi:hypothetical protein
MIPLTKGQVALVGENLRICTNGQNQRNRGKQSNNASQYKGVCLDKASGRWKAQISTGERRLTLGYYNTPEQAYAVYCEAAIRYHGEFARLA